MVTKDDVVGYLRKPTIGKLKCLHDKDITNDERFHKDKTLFPKINLIDELDIMQHKYVHKGHRLSMDDSLFIVGNPQYWDMYTKIDLSLLAFGVTISDALIQYILLKETEVLNNSVSNGEYGVALQTLTSKWWTIHNLFLIREVEDTDIELQRCLINTTGLQQLIKYTGFSSSKRESNTLNSVGNTNKITPWDINKLYDVRRSLNYIHTDISRHIKDELDEIIDLLQTGYLAYLKQTEQVH